ncbi:MAG: hypothetical protein K2R98_08240 [Gemmataceae bacterium]|nr:hypothetical protein [Gemmataceae bacterium]
MIRPEGRRIWLGVAVSLKKLPFRATKAGHSPPICHRKPKEMKILLGLFTLIVIQSEAPVMMAGK